MLIFDELIYQNGTGPMYDVRNTRTLNLGKSAELSKALIPDFGLNKSAARYAGINEKKNIILSMAIAGALAGDVYKRQSQWFVHSPAERIPGEEIIL